MYAMDSAAYLARTVSYACKMFMKSAPVACTINVYDRNLQS